MLNKFKFLDDNMKHISVYSGFKIIAGLNVVSFVTGFLFGKFF